MTTTAADLLQAIIGVPTLGPDGQPDGGIGPPDLDPGLRLAYADFLEETAGTVPCERCEGEGGDCVDTGGNFWQDKCCTCDGKGWLPGPQAARAEFIRVQIALAEPLRVAHTCGRSGNGACCECARLDTLRRREGELLQRYGQAWGACIPWISGIAFSWQRGFPARLTCTSRDWWGTSGQPGHGPALVRAAPLGRVEVSDWLEVFLPDEDAPGLPRPLRDLLHWPGGMDGRDALSAAVLAFARLPPCGECGGRGSYPANSLAAALGPQDLPRHCRPCHGLGRQLPREQA